MAGVEKFPLDTRGPSHGDACSGCAILRTEKSDGQGRNYGERLLLTADIFDLLCECEFRRGQST